ncbi:MaoC family dehydratase [Sphingomonas sp. CL5.1]|uniref:MaoC family dehydratase n=1 Tax=Sphingomonas sp. CL5.1 TaxID=2653203 RepID=UPI001582B173|nr:MaoC family dehydratase [Sphingomonas sp. CL5.1]QKS00579.1 MaoC family dehydratase [Sphingomonas sp. CL5.1]
MAVNYQELATGKYYEELEPGMVFRHSITRTVTEADNLMFSALTYNCAWLHMDDEYCKTTIYGKRLVNSLFTLALACGVTAGDTTLGTTLGNLGFSDIKFPKPVFIGDTLYVETEILGRRESRSRPDTGIVEFETRARNQRDELVCSLRRTGLMMKKSALQAA